MRSSNSILKTFPIGFVVDHVVTVSPQYLTRYARWLKSWSRD